MEIRTREQYISYIRRTSTIPKGKDGSTDIKLIEKMVNKLPVDWSNPNLKILDPGFGFGGYLFFVYLKLIQFHSEEHILNNMLYGVEIEDFRFELVKHKLKIKNLIKGDFLDNKILKYMKFDVIVGNPPYEGKKQTHQKFFNKAYELLEEHGTMAFIQPATPYMNKKDPRSHENKMREIIMNNEVSVTFHTNKIFDVADVNGVLAETVLTKKKNNNPINSVKYTNGSLYENCSLSDINM